MRKNPLRLYSVCESLRGTEPLRAIGKCMRGLRGRLTSTFCSLSRTLSFEALSLQRTSDPVS